MPTRSEPPTEFGGECAFAVSLGKKVVAGNPRHSVIRDGKKYVFSNPVAKLLWSLLPGRREKAEANWAGR
jgi:hypothetical protein